MPRTWPRASSSLVCPILRYVSYQLSPVRLTLFLSIIGHTLAYTDVLLRTPFLAPSSVSVAAIAAVQNTVPTPSASLSLAS